MKITKAILYTYVFTFCFAVLYYFLNKYFLQIFIEKYPNKPIIFFQSMVYLVFAGIYMWIPGIVALFFAKKEKFSIPIFKKPNKYYFYVILLPFVIGLLILFISTSFAKIDLSILEKMVPSSFYFFNSNALNYLIFFVFSFFIMFLFIIPINTFFSLGEELMWRGYLIKKLKKVNFWKTSLIIGIVWGIWHFPIIILFGHNYPDARFLGLIWMVVLSILSTPLLVYFRNKTQSVLGPAIFHSIFNKIASFLLVLFHRPNNLLIGATGIAAFIVWLIVDLFLFFMVQKNKNY
jgi:membrane protease YdiL (CAAX protease family)